MTRCTFRSVCGRWFKTVDGRNRHELFCERCAQHYGN